MSGHLQVLLEHLSDGAIYTSIVSIAVGGLLAQFKPWLLPQEEARKRVGLQRQRLVEHLAAMLHRVLNEAVLGTVPLRGDATHREDILANHADETFRNLLIFQDLERIHSRVKVCYTFLFVTAATGLIATLVALLFSTARPWVALVALGLILSQFVTVLVLRGLANTLENYERTT